MKTILTTLPTCLFLCAQVFAAATESRSEAKTAGGKPNIVFIIVDDLNGWIGCLNPALGAQTPQIDRLASRGTLFSNAHCAAPVCNPSRTALLTGLRPSTTGIYDNMQAGSPPEHPAMRAVLLPHYFKDHGYKILGVGKIPGHSTGRYPWDESFDPPERTAPPKSPLNSPGKFDWGAWPDTREKMSDWQLAGWVSSEVGKRHEAPFFLMAGFIKPHLPWYVPQEYFDRVPVGSVTPPPLRPDEREGILAGAKNREGRAASQLRSKRREIFAAYLAACAFADDCVGRVMAAIDAGPNRDNTVVVLCGDNGFQLGEKYVWGKGQLWEESTHVPLILTGPGIAVQQRCNKPVSLLDLYPTLVEMCGLPPVKTLEGASLLPLLKNPSAAWDHVALTTMDYKSHTVRTERWRYIRYADGAEELYDHASDPQEWKNLAGDAKHEAVKADLLRHLPTHNAPRNPNDKKKSSED
jgi:arylsulfatase A-like enzyme